MEADVLDTAGLTGAEANEETRAAVVTARRMIVAVLAIYQCGCMRGQYRSLPDNSPCSGGVLGGAGLDR
jgi:hypothetical protein